MVAGQLLPALGGGRFRPRLQLLRGLQVYRDLAFPGLLSGAERLNNFVDERIFTIIKAADGDQRRGICDRRWSGNGIGELVGLVGAHRVRNAHPIRMRLLSDGIFLCPR